MKSQEGNRCKNDTSTNDGTVAHYEAHTSVNSDSELESHHVLYLTPSCH
jgi:hypothetical protein